MNHYFTNNEDLKSEFRYLKYNYKDYELNFISDNGVFSKDKIDYGSRLLVETYLENVKEGTDYLDVGCGYGYIGLTLAKVLNINVDMIDINKRAIHLAKMNSDKNNIKANIFLSDGYENIKRKYDVIITNPPIRVGKEILLNILRGSKEFLNSDGEIWFVIRKDQGAKSIIKSLEDIFSIEVIKKDKGFFIIKGLIKN